MRFKSHVTKMSRVIECKPYQINVHMSRKMLEHIKEISKETGVTQSEIIRRAISNYFDKEV